MGRVITVARQFGSGGRELGRRLADDLHIAYYDKEILEEIAKRTDFSLHYIQQVVEKNPVPLFPIHIGSSFTATSNPLFDQNLEIFKQQSEIIKEMAHNSDCVIVGRCADYILEKDCHPFRIFVYADLDARVERCRLRAKEGEDTSTKSLAKRIRQIDKGRRRYYEFYTSKTWGAKENYDVLINTTGKDIKKLARIVAANFEDETSL